jgi:aryl-alcohol dehydrogenase-like predicted oxidoreductase
MHWPEPDEDVEEGWEAVLRLKEEGKIRWGGVSNFNVAQMKRAQAIGPVTSLQPPYSLISPEIEKELLPHCQATGVGALVYSPMKSGLLTGAMTRERVARMPDDDFRRRALAFQEPNLTWNLELQEMCREVGERHGRSAGEVALAWVLRNPAVTAAIVGLRSAAQFEGVKGAMEFRLSAEEAAELTGLRARLYTEL